uniref:phosphoribosyltransferase family protein n=1 Tax=Microbacterium sp. K41 TaxID=2305437 RepID=UPI0023AB48E7
RRAFRRRGFRVPDLLVRRAGASTTRVLRWTRAAHDQRILGAMERRDNVRAAMRAVADGRGAAVVVVDDVVTTGATLDEAARALEEAGYAVIALVALAATPTNAVSG